MKDGNEILIAPKLEIRKFWKITTKISEITVISLMPVKSQLQLYIS